jgi:hypothetical protein
VTSLFQQLQSNLAERYRLERQLGEGGMAVVFLATDLKHDRQVAVKVLRPELSAMVGADRFLREIRVTAQLQHPHILPLYDSGAAGDVLFYVMPLVQGESESACFEHSRAHARGRGDLPMSRFLIEVPHEETAAACGLAAESFLRTGSHFLARADWGCKDGDHKAWLIVEVESKEEARNIIPPALRPQARIVQLNTFTLADVEELRRRH